MKECEISMEEEQNPPKTSDYDKDVITEEILNAATAIYRNLDENGKHPSLQKIGESLEAQGFPAMNPIKVRKLLITAGKFSGIRIYESKIADAVSALCADGKSIEQIQKVFRLSRSSVHSYLPYSKIIYKMKESSVGAERGRLYRERKRAVEQLHVEKNTENLWKAVVLFAGYPFITRKGLKYSYTVKGNEIFFTRKEKSITKATVDMAFRKAMELQKTVNGVSGVISGPKKLGVFGASYLYPVFVRLGVIDNKGE